MESQLSQTITPTQMMVSIEDRSMLRAIKAAIMQLKGVTKVKEITPKTHYTEAEFYKKIEKSVKSAENNNVFAQEQGESVDQFIDRLLCIQ